MLNGPAKAFLKEPARLKYLLAPVLTKSAAEQARFYEVFDLWWNDMQMPLPLPPRKRWWKYIPPPIWWLLSALAALWLGYELYKWLVPPQGKPDVVVGFYKSGGEAVGDTFLFVNSSTIADSLEYRFEWRLMDGDDRPR
ncbi:MAG: hypothetical protein IPN33_20860 [Saprospiraceae bacterium]|nr:hypothetical protein [Saprospiraceae bacterium]